MQNPGGYVCLGLRMAELLVEEFNVDKTKVQMNYDLAHSKLMDRYIEVVDAPNPYPYAQEVEQVIFVELIVFFNASHQYYICINSLFALTVCTCRF